MPKKSSAAVAALAERMAGLTIGEAGVARKLTKLTLEEKKRGWGLGSGSTIPPFDAWEAAAERARRATEAREQRTTAELGRRRRRSSRRPRRCRSGTWRRR